MLSRACHAPGLQSLFCRAASQQLAPRLPCGWDHHKPAERAFVLSEPHEIYVSPVLQPVQVPLTAALPSQFGSPKHHLMSPANLLRVPSTSPCRLSMKTLNGVDPSTNPWGIHYLLAASLASQAWLFKSSLFSVRFTVPLSILRPTSFGDYGESYRGCQRPLESRCIRTTAFLLPDTSSQQTWFVYGK